MQDFIITLRISEKTALLRYIQTYSIQLNSTKTTLCERQKTNKHKVAFKLSCQV